MSAPRFSPAAFAIGFCATYALVFGMNWPLFLYYPLHGNFIWGPHFTRGLGPAMAWYGIMADSGIVALLAGLLVPPRALERLNGYLWLFPCAAMLTCVFLLRHFFG